MIGLHPYVVRFTHLECGDDERSALLHFVAGTSQQNCSIRIKLEMQSIFAGRNSSVSIDIAYATKILIDNDQFEPNGDRFFFVLSIFIALRCICEGVRLTDARAC